MQMRYDRCFRNPTSLICTLKKCHSAAALALNLMISGAAIAAPFTPRSDAEVLERLPYRREEPALREIANRRAAWARDPQNIELAVRLARSYFERAVTQGDPRYIGYAQAVLKAWWDLPRPPAQVLVMRASLRQYRHDFSGALADLSYALESDRRDSRAWALKAVIHAVQAEYEASRQACDALFPLVPELIGVACIAFLDGLTGHAREAHATLKRAYERASNASADQQAWALTRLAEIAWRLNDPTLAEQYFRDALSVDATDTFVLAAYADFLLDYRRANEVVVLLGDKTRADPLLLRLALAEEAVNAKGLRDHRAALLDRYAAARLRGDTTHEQEESRFRLHVLKDAGAALELARRNWQVQREPRDARVLLEASIALRQPAAAQPVIDWMTRSGIEDWYLEGLARRLALLPKDAR